MALLHLPSPLEEHSLLKALSMFDEPAGAYVAVRVGPGGITAGAAAYLATWARWQRAQGRRFSLDGDPATLALLDRLGVTEALGLPATHDTGRADDTLYFPVRFIADGDDVFDTTNSVLELVVREFAGARPFLPALEWALNEVIDNIMIHAEAPVPGAVCARYDPATHRLDVGVADVGQGILRSLQPVLDPWESHGDAIRKAVQRGVTRDIRVGQGNGLAGALQISERNRGDFVLWTGDALLRFRHGREQGFEQFGRPLPGTGVAFRLDPRTPVDLADTFIGAPGYTYLEAAAEHLEEEGLLVRAEVSNTGTRAPARRLRNKILNLLPDMEAPLVIDFSGVDRAASSFLDELLGRLVAELGPKGFKERIRLANMNEQLVDMANVVIGQRLEQEGRTL